MLNQIVDSGVNCTEDIKAFGLIKVKFDGEFTTNFDSSFSTVVEPGKRPVVLIGGIGLLVRRIGSAFEDDVNFDGI